MKYIVQDATRENENRLRREKALALSKSRDKKDETIAAIFFPALGLILAITGTCFIILNVNWKSLVHWYNDLPWVGNLFILLPSLAIILWFYIRRSARRS